MPLLQIKDLLSQLSSADIEIIMKDCLHLLKRRHYEEAQRVFRTSTDPKTIKKTIKMLKEMKVAG